MRILAEVYGNDARNKPRIYTSRFLCTQHQVRRPRCDQPVLLDYIMIDHPVVFNHLGKHDVIINTFNHYFDCNNIQYAY